MNTATYRVARGKLHRLVPISPEAPNGYKTVQNGETFVPTDEELRTFRDCFDGPVGDVANSAPQMGDLEGRVTQDLAQDEKALRDVIRTADKAYLYALLGAESLAKTPRPKVLEMIRKRLDVIDAPVTS